MEDSLALVYISYLLEDDNILLLEVWDRVLYARTKEGRNTFISKKGLEFNEQCYYRADEYKSIVKRYHPDKARRQEPIQKRTTEITRLVNSSRQQMEFLQRSLDAVNFLTTNQQFRDYTSSFKTKRGAKLRKQFREACEKGRFRHCFKSLYNQDNSASVDFSRHEERVKTTFCNGEESLLDKFTRIFARHADTWTGAEPGF